MKYRQINVEGRPIFDELESGESTYVKIDDGSRTLDQKIWWNDKILKPRHIDSAKVYKFNLLEGRCVDTQGRKVKSISVWRIYDQDRIIYDASYCRVHKRTMVRESYKNDIDLVSLPSGYDSVYNRLFPNSALEHPACSSISSYTSLSWICPECTEAETKWLEKNLKPEIR